MDHFISSCPHLSQFDRTQIAAKARLTSSNQLEEVQPDEDTEVEANDYTEPEDVEVEYLPHND